MTGSQFCLTKIQKEIFRLFKNKISYLEANSWIDVQTDSIVIETNFIYKFSGVYVINFLVIELTIDDYEITNITRFLTPLYKTTTQIVFTIFTFIASVLMMGFSIFDMK